MIYDPWQIDEDRSGPRTYVLSGTERLYCATGNHKSYDESQLVDQLSERVKALPTRIQDLIDDICLLHYSDREFLDADEQEILWQEILDITQRSPLVTDEAMSHIGHTPEEYLFGYELGHILRRLHHGDSSRIPLLWGMILGLMGTDHANIREQREFLGSFVEYVETRWKERARAEKKLLKDEQWHREVEGKLLPHINRVLQASPINASAEDLGMKAEFLTAVIASDDTDDVADAIEGMIDRCDLECYAELQQTLADDIETIHAISPGGYEAVELLWEFYRDAKSDHSTYERIDKRKHELPTLSYRKTQRGEILNRLDPDDDREQLAWPVFEVKGRKYKVTEYGLCLLHTIFDQDDSFWVYKYMTARGRLDPRQRHWIEEFSPLD